MNFLINFFANFFHWLGRYIAATKKYALAHKVVSAIALVVVLGGGYYIVRAMTSTTGQVHYVLGTASTSTVIAVVSASGQVAASDQINVTAKVSGELTWVGVKAGDKVRAGQALMTVDNTDAKQAVVDAQKALQADQLQFQKDSAQAPISYQNDQNALVTAQENLADDYNDTYNDISSTFLDLPAVVTGMQDILYGYDLDPTKSQWNMDVLLNLFSRQSSADTATASGFRDRAKSDYSVANDSYTASLAVYKTTTRASNTATTESMLTQSTTILTSVAQALQTELNFLGAIADLSQTFDVKLPVTFTTLQTNTRTYLNTTNGDLSTLLAQKKTLDQAKQTILTDQQNIQLDQVGNQNGANPISLQIEKNNLDKQVADLATQESNLSDYTVTAPFAGTLASVAVQKGDNANGTVAVLITTQQVATLSLNEVDAAKISLGEKATLTFDAIDALTLTGTVAEIDPVGTVSQGVVSYTVKITFDSQDSRIKPGMTVNADIQSAVHTDVLVVPSSAVKTQGGQSYVMVFDPAVSDADIAAAGTQGVLSPAPPMQVPVTVGISDDTNVEITSGLAAGAQVVVRTTTGAPTTATAARTTTGATAGARGNAGFGGGGATLRGL